jgi:choline dehydrogenase-like flavoprotein
VSHFQNELAAWACPKGENRALSAADSFGRVHGVEGLRITDSSLLCAPTIVNPQGTVMGPAARTGLETEIFKRADA